MNRVTRDSFVASGNSLALADLDAADTAALAKAGLDPAVLARIAGADGVIAGKAELGRLFGYLDRLDRDGSYGSLATTTKNEAGHEVPTASGHALAALHEEIAEARLKHSLGGAVAPREPANNGALPGDPSWLKTAYGERGVEEVLGTRKSNPRILEYFERTYQKGQHTDDTGRENAWCAAFVTFTLSENKLKNGGAVGAREYEKWGEPSEPFRGAVVVLQKGKQKHVAFLAGVDKNGRNVYLGGNQDDGVNLSRLKNYEVIAIRKPAGFEVPAELKRLPKVDIEETGAVSTR